MPSWGEILSEVNATAATGVIDFDGVRNKYVAALARLTNRSLIVYAADFVNGGTQASAITLGDMTGMMEVCRGLPTDVGLDIILHSPGGSPEATDSIVKYLRTKFADIRVFVPLAAMSAATMWALSSNRIVMGKHSQLGPIDPQISIEGRAPMPSRTIIDQFERAKVEVAANPAFLGAWAPIIKQYGPGILEYCINGEKLAKGLVEDWLTKYMFSGDANGPAKAQKAAEFFSDYSVHKSHSIGISRDQARSVDVVVDDLETDAALQDAVLSAHHATMITLQGPAIKIIENHLGRRYLMSQQAMVVQQGGIPFQIPPGMLPQAVPPAQNPPAPMPPGGTP